MICPGPHQKYGSGAISCLVEISIVIPVYNSAHELPDLIQSIRTCFPAEEAEVILVNDGSSDHSDRVGAELVATNKELVFLSLRRNFGEHNAVMCGLNFARGRFVVIMDDDGQNPPEEIVGLVHEIKKGYDVVYSQYLKKRHHFFRNLGSRFSNFVANRLMTKPDDLYLSSFKIIHRDIVNEIIRYKGPFPYIDGLILRCTSNIGKVNVVHQSRKSGRSGYTIKKLLSLYMNMFLNFSVKPLRMFTLIGALIFVSGLLLSGYFIYSKLTASEYPGWTSTVIFILLLSGFQILFLGLIGEYLGKQYLDQNHTPQWVLKSIQKHDAG